MSIRDVNFSDGYDSASAPTGSLAASGISVTPSGNLAADDVQEALTELQTDIDTRATSTALSDHLADAAGAHAASAISNTPSGNLAATTVQAALDELQTDVDTRAPKASPTFTGNATFDTNTLYVDGTNNRVGVGTSGPDYPLDVVQAGAATIQARSTGSEAVYRWRNATKQWKLGTSGSNLVVGDDNASTSPLTITGGALSNSLIINADGTTYTKTQISTKTSAHTASSADTVLLVDCTSGAVTITLPAADSTRLGRVYTIKKIDSSANAVTIDGNASETIDGATTQTISVQYESMTIICNGTAWYIL